MLRKITFQFFAAEDGGMGSNPAPAQPGQSSAPAQAQNAAPAAQQPQQGQNAPVAQAQEASFEELIKGKYKQDFDRRVQGIVRDRLKGTQQTIGKLSPILDVLGQQYGIDVSDLDKIDYDALTRKLTDDKRLYEQEAMEKGIPLETLMQMKQVERQNAALRRENEAARGEAQRREEFDRLVGQFAEVQQLYPGADLSVELQNPQFGRLISSGVPARTAYEVLHQAEINAARTRIVAQAAQQQAVAGIQANGMRPQEGAADAGNGMPVQFDPRKLTKQQREEIKNRVHRGERVTF